MSIPALILSIIFFILALVLVVVVTFQSGKTNGLSGVFGGSSDTFLAKNKAKSMDARLAKITKWVAIAFVVLALVLCFLL